MKTTTQQRAAATRRRVLRGAALMDRVAKPGWRERLLERIEAGEYNDCGLIPFSMNTDCGCVLGGEFEQGFCHAIANIVFVDLIKRPEYKPVLMPDGDSHDPDFYDSMIDYDKKVLRLAVQHGFYRTDRGEKTWQEMDAAWDELRDAWVRYICRTAKKS